MRAIELTELEIKTLTDKLEKESEILKAMIECTKRDIEDGDTYDPVLDVKIHKSVKDGALVSMMQEQSVLNDVMEKLTNGG